MLCANEGREAVEFRSIGNRVARIGLVKFRHFHLEPGRIICLVTSLAGRNLRNRLAREFFVVVPAGKNTGITGYTPRELCTDTFRIFRDKVGIDLSAVQDVGHIGNLVYLGIEFLVAGSILSNHLQGIPAKVGTGIPAEERPLVHENRIREGPFDSGHIGIEVLGRIALERIERYLVRNRLGILEFAREDRVCVRAHILAPGKPIVPLIGTVTQGIRERTVLDLLGSHGVAAIFPVPAGLEVVAIDIADGVVGIAADKRLVVALVRGRCRSHAEAVHEGGDVRLAAPAHDSAHIASGAQGPDIVAVDDMHLR